MKLYRNFLLGLTLAVTVSGAEFRRPIGTIPDGGSITFANGSTISGDSGAAFALQAGAATDLDLINSSGQRGLELRSGGANTFNDGAGNVIATATATGMAGATASTPLALSDGATIPTGMTLAFANGSTISGDSGAATLIQGGTDENVEIHLASSAGTPLFRLYSDDDGEYFQMSNTGNVTFFNPVVTVTDANTSNSVVFNDVGELFMTLPTDHWIRTSAVELPCRNASGADPADGNVRVWAPCDASAAPDNVLQVTDQASTDADFTHAAIDIEAP